MATTSTENFSVAKSTAAMATTERAIYISIGGSDRHVTPGRDSR
jgi:hypothetical protein